MEEKKKSNAILIVLLVILLLACVGMGAFIFVNKDKLTENKNTKTSSNVEKKETTKKEEKEEDVTSETTTSEDNSNKAKCSGTYYVNGNKNDDAYTFNEDGTWHKLNSEEGGVFVINENTITLIVMKHTTGPREEDPIYYNPKSYLISDDCLKIRLTESGSHTSAYLVKVG